MVSFVLVKKEFLGMPTYILTIKLNRREHESLRKLMKKANMEGVIEDHTWIWVDLDNGEIQLSFEEPEGG